MGLSKKPWGAGWGLSSLLMVVRQRWVNKILSRMYGQPMQVNPRGYVGVAGVVVLWYLHEGQRHYIMVRSTEGGDGLARFVSCLGLGGNGDMASAVKTMVKAQLGEAFLRMVGPKVLAADRVACAPLFTYTEESLGVPMPVQSLVWVVQVSPHGVDLIEAPKGMQAVMVAEAAMAGAAKISPTHKALWQSVGRHLPQLKMPKASANPEAVEETVKDIAAGGGRVLH